MYNAARMRVAAYWL